MSPTGTAALQLCTPLRWLHQRLMPDYNRPATLYWWTVVPLGLLVIGGSLWSVSGQPWPALLQIGAGVLMAAAAGSFPITIPRTKTSFGLGEVFTFLLLFIHGPAAAALAAAAEAGAGSLRTSKRWTSRIGGPAIAGLAMATAGGMLEWMLAAARGSEAIGLGTLGAITLWFTIAHFVLNTAMIAALPRLKRGEWLRWSDLTGNFGVTLGVSVVSACSAALLSETFRDHTLTLTLTLTPAIALLVMIVRSYIGQQEASRALSEAEAQAARREADIVAQHLREMHYIAFHDAHTGLPNRRMLLDELQKAVQLAQADQRSGYVLMFLDFDRFKLINDSLGHAAGDRFLTLVSERLVAQVREDDLVARLGGDEFAILLRRKTALQGIHELAHRIQEAVCKPYRIGESEVTSSASIGITLSEYGYPDADEVLRDADIAMYRAKATGKARHVIFDSVMHAELTRKMRLESDLHTALFRGEVELDYQPVIDVSRRRLLGFEALARWTHPEFGVVQPAEFIQLAEESALILQLTDYMLACACRQLQAWHARGDEWRHVGVHVNVSDKDIAQRTLLARVREVLAQTGLEPQHLTLELNEGIMMKRLATERAAMQAMRDFGVRLAIDDFGVGYSSLSLLSALPIDMLKIHRSFVAGIEANPGDGAIVRTVLQLGRSLGRQVVAEGVETEAQLASLREWGCEGAQGHLLGPPMSAQAVSAWLEQLERLEHAPPTLSAPTAVALLH